MTCQDGLGRLRRVWGGRFKNPLCGVPLKPTDRRVPDVRGLAGGSAGDPALFRLGGFSGSLTIWMEERETWTAVSLRDLEGGSSEPLVGIDWIGVRVLSSHFRFRLSGWDRGDVNSVNDGVVLMG